MLGLLFLYLIWTRFHRLAKTYGKENAWLYPLMMIIVYYGLIVVFNIGIGLLSSNFYNLMLLMNTGLFSIINIISVVFSLGVLYGTYYFLEKKWRKETPVLEDEINTIGKS